MIKLELPDEMVEIIGKSLGAAPYSMAAPVISELQKQIAAQRDNTPEGKVIPPLKD